MGYLAMGTRDYDQSLATEVLGLRMTLDDGDRAYLSAADRHHELVYVKSEVDGIDHIGLVADVLESLEIIRRRLEAAGFPIAHGPAAFGPDRYGHINIHPQNATAMKDFLVDFFGFRVSDVIGTDFAYFLRCNPDHHGIALIKGRGSLHHHAWQTQSIADLGRLGDRLFARGRRLIWGPVRHGAGHNIAAYYVEPNGTVVELYTSGPA